MAIDELAKSPGRWCRHCAPGVGCRIYEERPASCRQFSCLWLSMAALPDALKPDRSKVVLALDADGTRLMAHCDPADPFAWRREPMLSHLRSKAREAWGLGRVLVRSGDQTWLVTPTGDLAMGVIPSHVAYRVEDRAGEILLTVLVPREGGGFDPISRSLGRP
jgi:hypothetical protein